jgi:chromate transport protein ChrA
MKLSKISYTSAVFFGAFALVMSLFYGTMQWIARDALMQMYNIQITLAQAFFVTPLVGGIVGYLVLVVAIFIYNAVARKFPISWEVKK